ncbi:DUF748 domain-containing protein [Methylophilus sp. 3sh_L]|uniref:DUF748 domain-containing protein n=1 Tax=Methylophilus sp. 3sh_L TaxID=3377114 RepID=UPI00398F061C
MSRFTLSRASRLPGLTQSRGVKVAAGLVVFYYLFAWLAINPLAKWLLPWVAETQLASKASVEKVTFDPFSLTATIDKLALADQQGAPLAAFDRLVIDLEASGLFKWAWKLKQIQLTGPHVNVMVSKQGKLNWADLIAKLNENPSPPDQGLPRVIIEKIILSQGNIEYLDAQHDQPLRAALKPLDFELEGFSTLPQDRGDYLIAAKLPYQGGTVKWKGNFGVNPLASQGQLAIEALQIAKVVQWVNTAALPVKVETGAFSGQLNYAFSMHQQQPKLQLSDVQLRIENLGATMAPADKLTWASFMVTTKQLTLLPAAQLSLQGHGIDMTLNQLKLQKPQAVVSMDSSQLSLPSLSFTLDKQAQLQFENLDVHLQQAQVQHGQQTLLSLPELALEHASFNLADRRAKIGLVHLNQGQLSATQLASGLLDWQQSFEPTVAKNTSTTQPTAEQTAQTTESKPFHLSIDELALAHWHLTYTSHQFAKPLQATVGDMNLQLALDHAEDLTLSNMQLDASQLALQSDKQTLAQLGKLSVGKGHLALAQQKAEVAAIQLSGLKTSVIRQADQRLNWQTLLATPPAAAPKNTATSPTATTQKTAWTYNLKQLALQQAEVHIEDQSTSSPMILDVTDGQLSLTDLTQNLTRWLPVKAGFKVKQGGQLNLQGKIAAAPFKVDLQTQLSQLSLKPFAPLLAQVALLKLEDGAVGLEGRLQQSTQGSTRFDGGFTVNQLSIVEEESQQPFLRWQTLQADGVSLSLAPNKLQIDTLSMSQPQTKFMIAADRSLNVSKLMRTAPASDHPPASNATTSTSTSAAPTVANASKQSDFPVNIDSVRINNAELDFADLSLPQPFGTHINNLGGVINGISSNPASTAQVEMDGKVDDYGAARIRGSLQPFHTGEFTDLKLAFTNLEMNRLTPYSGKFAGRKITSGKLSVDLEYKIKQRKLAGENKFVIHKLTLGERVDSKDAANLPLDLAIAILEDSNGVIDLDLPVSGSLDDPKFSIGGIVWKAFTNILTKIVTAPFSALGKLFGSSEKLEAIVFDPGTAALSPPEQEKLQAVSSALSKRQQLKLGIVPGYDVAADSRAIQETTLRKQVAAEMGITLQANQTPGPIDLNNPKVQSALKALHDRLTNKGLLKRLASKLEKTPAGFYEEAQETLTTSITVSDADLQALAQARANAIQQQLLAAGLSQDRIAIAPPVAAKAERALVPTKLTLDAIKH